MHQAINYWNKQFGRKNKSCDFAGRQIEKSSYQKSGQYAWTTIQIGNQTLCCHVLTAKEKGDQFPVFRANGKQFEIQKTNNRYEIIETFQEEEPTFLEGEYGLKVWNTSKSKQNFETFQYIKVQIILTKHYEGFLSRFQQFMEAIFQTSCCVQIQDNEILFTCFNYQYEDEQTLLDRCVILNTYAQHFFEKQYHCQIHIVCGQSSSPKKIYDMQVPRENTLSIDAHIKFHTSAKEEMETLTTHMDGMYPYNYTYMNLRKVLEKKYKDFR